MSTVLTEKSEDETEEEVETGVRDLGTDLDTHLNDRRRVLGCNDITIPVSIDLAPFKGGVNTEF